MIVKPPESAPRRGFPLAIWLVVALQTMLMVGLTVLYPPFQAPDEAAHIDYVLAHRHGQWFDGTGERRLQAGVVVARGQVPATQFREHVGGRAPLPRSMRKSFDSLGTGASDDPFPNQMTQHPPLYYAAAAGFSYLLPGFDHRRFDLQIFWLRLFSVLLLAPVPLLIYGAARRAGRRHSVALVAAIIPLSMPVYLRTGASVTNDSLVTLLTVVVAALLVRVAWGDLGRRTAVLLGLAWGAALLTKGFALALPPAIVLAYLVGATGPVKDRFRAAWPGIVISGGVGLAVGGWWWIRNVVVYGTVQPDGFADLSDALRQQAFGRDRPGAGDIDFFATFFRLLGQRMWGSLGLTDDPSLPHVVLFTASALFLAALVASVVAGSTRFRGSLNTSGWTVGRALSLILPAALMLGAMYVGSRSFYLRGHQPIGINARYLTPAILGLAICAAVVLDLAAGRLRRWLPAVALVASLLFVALSGYRVLSVEMSSASPDPSRRLTDALHFVVGWAPFPSAVTGALVVLTVLLALASVVVLAVGSAREQPERSVSCSDQIRRSSGADLA
jgi:4-amino-4-deoxy-L-arabinose transferase-like glycosyltransferase